MLSSKYWITNCIILTILAFSTFATSLAYAAPLANNGKDWQNVNGNSWAWNYSPQTQITKENVVNLEIKWLAPAPGAAGRPAALQSVTLSEGITAPLTIRNGKVVGVTNFLRTIQWDLKTGKVLWTNDYDTDVKKAADRLPIVPSAAHLHGIKYWEAGNAILNQGIVCDIYGVNFDTGKTSFKVENLCADIPGNTYKYMGMLMAGGIAAVGTWDKGKQFIVGMHGTTSGATPSGRAFYAGLDMNTYQVVWRVFLQPPQDRPEKDWALQQCDIGYFVTTPCSKVASRDRSLLEYDWQSVKGEPPSRLNGVSGSWGQPVIDEDTGLLYLNTGNQSPYSNLTSRPGPNLYGSAIIAVDMNKGQMKWWVQDYPHDPYDWDCNWSGMLIDHPQLGKVYMKGCKDAYMFVIDALTGKPLQRWDTMVEAYGQGMRPNIIYDPEGVVPGAPNSWEGFKEMLTIPWAGAGKMEVADWARVDPTTVVRIGRLTGDPAYDGKNTVFYAPLTSPGYMTTIDLEKSAAKGGSSWITRPRSAANATLVAHDLVTGKTKWMWGPAPGNSRTFSSAMIATAAGVLIVPNVDGYMYFFDQDTGKVLHKINIGSPMLTGPSIGKDADGNMVITVVAGVGPGLMPITPSIPGTVVAIGLSDRAAAEIKTTTITTTSSTTITSATTQTVTTTSATTATTTLTSTQPAKTTTVVSEVTQTSGLPSEVTYAAVGVAVIAIAAAAVLVMRKK